MQKFGMKSFPESVCYISSDKHSQKKDINGERDF